MVYKIIPYSDDIIYTKPDNNSEFSGSEHTTLPLHNKSEYILKYNIGLIIKAELTVEDGWVLKVLENPFEKGIISIETKENKKDDMLIIDIEKDIGKLSIDKSS